LPWFTTVLVNDRVHRCFHVARSQGVPFSAFYMGTFLANHAHMLLLSLSVPIMEVYFQMPFFSETRQLWAMVLAALVAPVPMLLFAYTAALFFRTVENASKAMPLFSLLGSIPPFMAVYVLTLICIPLQIKGAFSEHDADIEQGQSLHMLVSQIHMTLSFVNPFYVLPGTFLSIGLSALPTEIPVTPYRSIPLELLPPQIFGSYAAVPIVGGMCLSFALAGALVLAHVHRRHISVETPEFVAEGATDQDVIEEVKMVARADPAAHAVLYRNLRHQYNTGAAAVHAVRGISLHIAHGECFTLLGPNGAGKTTTLDILTGAILSPTAGQVYLAGHEVTGSHSAQLDAFKSLGHCPQVDPLWPTLTGRQHLLFYARVKGVPASQTAPQTSYLLEALGLSKAADQRTETYSGGMKRKLSLGIALMASPPILILDEPSAAVDAAAKRHLWRLVKCRRDTQTVLLTTHSMEEAEALSDRLAVQVCGRLRCLGTPDRIKNTYGAGYRLEMFVSASAQEGPDHQILDFVRGFAGDAHLIEFHRDRYLFQLPMLGTVGAQTGELTLSQVFLRMRDAQERLGLRDFALSRPSLEQVFLRFAKEQQEQDLLIAESAHLRAANGA